MQIKPKKFVYYVERKPHWLSNRQGYFTMERNERVDEFSKKLMNKIRSPLVIAVVFLIEEIIDHRNTSILLYEFANIFIQSKKVDQKHF